MSSAKNVTGSMPTSTFSQQKPKTAKEIEQYWLQKGKAVERFEMAQNAVQLINASKTETRTYSTFSKETLRTYLKNPTGYYKNLRNLSRYLYYRSQPYRRLIWYNAGMLDTTARSIVPLIDPTKENDTQKTLKQFYSTAKVLEYANLKSEILKMNIIAWRDDCAFGCVYYDETGLFILPLDADYCKVTSIFYDGTLGFSMDMSYFDKYSEQLEFYGEPFTSMYNAYNADKVNGKWQPMPDEYCFCIKINLDDPTLPLPPYLSLFNSIISLCDSEELQAIRDEADIYKLLVLEMETIDGSNIPDDFTVDPSTATEYFNKLSETLPEYVEAAVSPMKITPVEFNKDQTSDINYVQNSTAALFNTSGGGQLLNSASISTTIGWEGAIINDGKYATMTVRPQVEAWINRWLSYYVSKPAKVVLLDVTPFTKKETIKSLKEQNTYGYPLKLLVNSLNGFTELETMSLAFLENECLHLAETWKPLQSSNTQSGSNDAKIKEVGQGAPEKDAADLTDAGDTSRNQ